MEFVAFNTDGEAKQQIEAVQEIVLVILNTNKEGRVFTSADIEDYDMVIQMAIVKGYSEFVEEVMKNPN